MNKTIHNSLNYLTHLGSLYVYLVILLLLYLFNQTFLVTALVLALIISYTIAVPIRIFYFKDRPKKQTYTNLITKISAASFPSIHALRVSLLATIFSLYFKNLYFTFTSILVVLLICYSRVYLKKHFVTDVVVGCLFGLMI